MHALSTRVAGLPLPAVLAGSAATGCLVAAASSRALAARSAPAPVLLNRPRGLTVTRADAGPTSGTTSTSTTLKVEGMVCSKCTDRVEKALLAAPGVTAATADLGTGAVTVEGPAAADAGALAALVTGIGFPAAPAGA